MSHSFLPMPTTVTTLENVSGNYAFDYPQNGKIRIGASDGSVMVMTALPPDQVQIEIDVEGDGTFESNDIMYWTDLAREPARVGTSSRGHPSTDAEALLERAVRAARERPLDEALEAFRTAEGAFRDAHRPEGAVRVWIEEARALAGASSAAHVRRAHALLDDAEEALTRSPSPALRASLDHARGYAWLRSGQPGRALTRSCARRPRSARRTTGRARPACSTRSASCSSAAATASGPRCSSHVRSR